MALELTEEQVKAGWELGTLGDYLKFSNGRKSPGDNPDGSKKIWGSNGVIGHTDETNALSNTVVVGRVGAYCGSVAFSREKSWVTDNAIKGERKLAGDDVRFWYYKLTSMNLSRYSHGTSQPLINQGILNSLAVSVPSQNERNRIAEILGSLDDKIEANNALLNSLDELGNALILQKINDVSETCQLSEVAEVVMGQSPAGATLNEDSEGLIFYQGRRDFGFRYPTPRVFTSAPTRIAEPGDILLSVRAPVGDLNRTDEECCVGRGIAAIRAKNSNTAQLFYLLKNMPNLWSPYEGEGTVFSSINRKQVQNLRIPVVDNFEDFEDIEKSILSLTQENLDLSETRDLLIRKLIK